MAKDDVQAEVKTTEDAPVAKKMKIDPAVEDATAKALEDINEAEAKLNALEDECAIEICKVEQKFVGKKQPLYEQREKFIEKIDNFWQIALCNHPQLSCLISEKDEEALSYLKKVKVDSKTREEEVTEEDGSKLVKSLNHSISFEFAENPFFENTTLTKSFFQVMDEVVSEGDQIKWKEGQNLIQLFEEESKKLGQDKNGHKNGAGDAKKEGETEDGDEEENELDAAESFFAWFEDHEDPASDETAELIKTDLWDKALLFYTAEMDADGDEEEIDLEMGSGEEAEE